MEIDFDKIFKISFKAQSINRSHPEVPKDMKWALQFTIMHGLCTMIYLSMAYNIVLFMKLGDYYEASRHGIASVVYITTSFMYFTLVVKRNTIIKLMNMMKDDFKKSMPLDEKKIVLEYAKKGGSMCKLWLVLCVIALSVFPAKHLVYEIYLYIKGEFILVMPYELTYPSPLEEYKFQPFVYAIIYTTQFWYILYVADMYIGFVPLGPSFMLHACGQLEIVKKKASEVFSNPEEDEEVKEKLNEIVKHLQDIYAFIDCVKDSFRAVYELMLKGTTILLPVSLYQVLTSIKHGDLRVEFVTFIVVAILVSSSPCYYSEMLMEKGEDVRLAIYLCGWEATYNHGARKTILIILQRALRPTSIRSMFRPITLEALADVLQQSYAIFNLMNATWM